MSLLLPKFLNELMASQVIQDVLESVMEGAHWSIYHLLEQHDHCHVVVLGPAMKDDRARNFPDWPNYSIQPQLIAELSRGTKSEWAYPFDDIAHCKALQLWHDRNDNRTDIMPHLLFPGDTPYWGGVKRDGIVVTCSGFQCHFDRMVAGMIADILIAHAYHTWTVSEERNKVSFLS